MNARRRFVEAVKGKLSRPRPDPEASEFGPGVAAEDAVFAARAMLAKWADVEYVGDGQAEAEARRSPVPDRPSAEDPKPETLREKWRRLKAAADARKKSHEK